MGSIEIGTMVKGYAAGGRIVVGEYRGKTLDKHYHAVQTTRYDLLRGGNCAEIVYCAKIEVYKQELV